MRYQISGGMLRIGAQIWIRLESSERRPEQNDFELAVQRDRLRERGPSEEYLCPVSVSYTHLTLPTKRIV